MTDARHFSRFGLGTSVLIIPPGAAIEGMQLGDVNVAVFRTGSDEACALVALQVSDANAQDRGPGTTWAATGQEVPGDVVAVAFVDQESKPLKRPRPTIGA